MPEEFSTAEQLHDDYVTAIRKYQDWIKGQEQKIMLWNNIRSVLLEAEAGEAPMSTQDVLEALGSNRTKIDDLTWAESTLLETNVGKIRGQGKGSSHSDKMLETERLLQRFEEVELSDTVPFFYFGWQLVLRKIVVEYHAQRLRIYLYKGDLDTDRFPAMPDWPSFRNYATDAKTDGNELRVKNLFGDWVGVLNSHGVLTNSVVADSTFFEKLSEKDYFAQMDVIYQLSYSLSSSFVGQRLLADLAWGYFGYHPDSGPNKRFALVDFFVKPSNPDERVVNWDARSGPTDYIGLNQQTFFAASFGAQIGPAYHRAAAMARDGDDITDAERNRIESEAAAILDAFTNSPQSATGDFALPMMGVQNQHTPSQAQSYLELLDGSLDSKFAAIPGEIIADWAKATGIRTELEFGPNESITVTKVEQLPDRKLRKAFKEGVDAADANDPTYPKWAAQGSIALRRFLHLYNVLGNVYGIALFFTADDRNSSPQQTLEDIKQFAGFAANTYALTRSLSGGEVEWESIKLEGSTDSSWRPTRFSRDPEELANRLSDLDSRVKQTLISDLEETIKHLNRLDATVNVMEYNTFDAPSTSKQWTLQDWEKQGLQSKYDTARTQLGNARAKAELFKTRLQNNDLSAASELMEGGKLDAIRRSSQNALTAVDEAAGTLAQNAGAWDAAKVETELFSQTGMTSGLSVNTRSPYSQFTKLSATDSPLSNASLRTSEALDDIVKIELGTDELGELLSEGGLEKRLQRAEEIQSWFARHGDEADLQYTMRTADMLEAGPTAARPAMGKFLARVVLELVGTVVDVLDLIINTMNSIKAWNKGDHSAAGGFALQVAGTGAMLLAGGPVAWIGAAAVLAGIALVVFTSDTDLTVWIRHTFFGRYWLRPAGMTWDEEYNRWGSFLGTLLYKAGEWMEDPPEAITGEGDGETATPSGDSGEDEEFMAPTAWNVIATYTEASRDPDMMRYFAAQLAWFYKHAKPFTLPTAKLERDNDGFPMLEIEVQDPATSGENSETFGFGSMILVRPVIFTSPAADSRVRCWRQNTMDLQISDDMRTYQWTEIGWDEPNWKDYRQYADSYNLGATPTQFDLAPSNGHLEYSATVEQYALQYQNSTNPSTDGVWIDSVIYEIGFTDSFKEEWKAAFNDDDRNTRSPLNWLIGRVGPDLENRLDQPAQITGGGRSNFEIAGELLTKDIGVEVYHIPAELMKATRQYASARGLHMADALRMATLNPFAARVGTTLTIPSDYPKSPPEWMDYV